MELLKRLSVLCMAVITMTAFTSCDEIFGSDDEPIGMNYNKALAGKWKVVRAGRVEDPAYEMVYIDKDLAFPTSLEWVEFADGTAHFHFSTPVTLESIPYGSAHGTTSEISDYTCECDLDGQGILNFQFGFTSEDGNYYEFFKEWINAERYFKVDVWAYGKNENHATTLFLMCNDFNSSSYGYEMKRY